jgi:hypothetical protein
MMRRGRRGSSSIQRRIIRGSRLSLEGLWGRLAYYEGGLDGRVHCKRSERSERCGRSERNERRCLNEMIAVMWLLPVICPSGPLCTICPLPQPASPVNYIWICPLGVLAGPQICPEGPPSSTEPNDVTMLNPNQFDLVSPDFVPSKGFIISLLCDHPVTQEVFRYMIKCASMKSCRTEQPFCTRALKNIVSNLICSMQQFSCISSNNWASNGVTIRGPTNSILYYTTVKHEKQRIHSRQIY